MRDVVIDEWVLIRAFAAERRQTAYETESVDVLTRVQLYHRWVFTDDIVEVYQRRFYSASDKGAIWLRLLRSFRNALVSQTQSLWLFEFPECEGAYHHKDRRWIHAAGASPPRAVFVTGDERLLAQLAATDVPQRCEFVARFITEAIAQELTQVEQDDGED